MSCTTLPARSTTEAVTGPAPPDRSNRITAPGEGFGRSLPRVIRSRFPGSTPGWPSPAIPAGPRKPRSKAGLVQPGIQDGNDSFVGFGPGALVREPEEDPGGPGPAGETQSLPAGRQVEAQVQKVAAQARGTGARRGRDPMPIPGNRREVLRCPGEKPSRPAPNRKSGPGKDPEVRHRGCKSPASRLMGSRRAGCN
jgi:hypothetical protein